MKVIRTSYALQRLGKEDRPIRKFKLKTDSARKWEMKNWTGDEFAVIKNDCEDLEVKFVEGGDDSDIFEFPRALFGSTIAKIELGVAPDGRRYQFKSVFLNHSAVKDGEIIVIIGGAASVFSVSAGGFVQIRGYKHDDYYDQAYTAIETSYAIGTAAVASNPNKNLFKAHQLFLTPTTNCLIRFEGSLDVQHFLAANIEHEFSKILEEIFRRRKNNDFKVDIIYDPSERQQNHCSFVSL